jgi:hypothetical protein
MDAAEPPRLVFEGAAECADRDRAEELFRQPLAQALARGWVVTMRIGAATLPAVSAEGEITDDRGTRRGHQVLPGNAADCAALARAMGAWASGVLQTEAAVVQAPAQPESRQATGSAGGTLPPLPPAPAPPAAPPAPPVASPAPPVAPLTRPAPPAAHPPIGSFGPEAPSPGEKHEEAAPLELGVGTFLMIGGGAGAYFGVAPFLIDDVGQAVFLRPSVAVGKSIATDLPSTWVAARLDTCMRLPGRYATRGGLQLDLCGGADVGFSYISSGTLPGNPPTGQTLPYVDLGPSLDLRAEAGSVAVTLRGLAGIDVARQGFDDVKGTRVDVPMWSWRLELDLAWVFPSLRADKSGTNSASESKRPSRGI